MDLRTLDVVLHGIPVVTMGCSIDSLDVCFGTQLTDSRGDIGVIYAWGLMHVFALVSPVEILGHSMKFIVLDRIL